MTKSALDLADTYAFIKPFLAQSELSVYGDNALPLYGVALYLDVDDLRTFATESLTDHPSDKKADIIYINEADGVACIAQGFTARSWAKPAAPANKACDLNTAAAWLLQSPIADVPERIRAHAKLLRDGLALKTITKLVFAYAHNCLDSTNVRSELAVVQKLLEALPIVAGAEVEVVELGIRQIENLFLTARGSIQVGNEIQLDAHSVITKSGDGWSAHVLTLSGEVLYDLYDAHKGALFSANLRDFLGARKVSGNVNNGIKQTVEESPLDFFVLNNGVTMVTKKADHNHEKRTLTIQGVSIVNGAQTTGAVHAAGRTGAAGISVLARVIVVDDPTTISRIVAGNNTQNSIVAWDRRSNDPVQIRLKQEFQEYDIDYVHRRDSSRKSKTSLFVDQVGQMLCAFAGDLQTAIRAKADIFESDTTYARVFAPSLSVGHVFAVQALGWAYDKLKQDLKAKSTAGQCTDLQTKQLKLIDYPASKQFLVHVVGRLREEIAGAKLPLPSDFRLRDDHIVENGQRAVEAWLAVLKAILPIMAQKLPAEEYQVVRSSEHAADVADKVRAIVEGLEQFQSAFTEIRSAISPSSR